MFSYQVQIYEKQNNTWGWFNLTGWTRPSTDGTRFDETLDSGTLNLSCVPRQKAIKPDTRLRFIVSENGTEKERIYRLVASTRKTKRRYYGTPLYDWTINTIEPTKLLERRLIDTMTVTKYLANDYASISYPAPYKRSVGSNNFERSYINTNYRYMTPYTIGQSATIYNPARQILFPTSEGQGYSDDTTFNVSVTSPSGETTTYTTTGADSGNTLGTYTFDEIGDYQIITAVYGQLITLTGYTFVAGSYTYKFSVYENASQRSQPTISSVCKRLLSAGVTRRKNIETQEFVLDPTFDAEYSNVLAPEFSFTNCTLFEALLQVGGYIHAIPRLIPRSTSEDTRYYVTFDKLGGNEQAPTMPPFIYSENTIDVNDWCGQIDTPAQNLVNTEDTNAGSITELGNSFITVRTEDGQVEVNGNNVIIRVSKPIQRIVKVECGYVNGNTLVGDITPYVYESEEYKALSSYWGSSYPYSKAWALYYSQGSNTIGGLTFVWEEATSDMTAYANYSIANIINAVAGTSLTWRDTSSGKFMRKLAFRVTYVPIAQARVKAHKPSLAEGGAVNNALTYNQSANIAETSYYGEKMRGAIARLGHDVETRTYDVFSYDQLPKVGQLLDGKYIAHIDYEWDITKVRITLALTKDFNMLSQFVGLNSNYRLYDISEKQSVERNVNYDEFVVIGDAPAVDMSRYLMNKAVSRMMVFTLGEYYPIVDQKLKVARLTPYDANGNEIPNRRVLLPAVAFPFGTSIALNVSYFDNYGAGYQQSDAYESESNKSVQRLVPYTDSFGEIAELKITFDNTTGWEQSSASAYDDNSPAMLYPQATTEDSATGVVTTGDNHIILEKDSREVINFTYQLHFVTTRASIVLGSALSKYNPFVSIAQRVSSTVVSDGYSILWLPTTINGLNKYIDATNATVVDVAAIAPTIPTTFVFSAGQAPIACKSYAVCKKTTTNGDTKYELFFGENIDLEQGETPPTLTFAGAIPQACNQDRPQCIKFLKNGTARYVQAKIGIIPVPLTLTKNGTYSGDDLLLGTRISTAILRYDLADGKQKYFVPIPGQSDGYVLFDDLVTAYDFE